MRVGGYIYMPKIGIAGSGFYDIEGVGVKEHKEIKAHITLLTLTGFGMVGD